MRLDELARQLQAHEKRSRRETDTGRRQLREEIADLDRRIEISATITEAVAQTLHNAKDLPKEVSGVAHRDIAAARFVPQSDARVVQDYRLAA